MHRPWLLVARIAGCLVLALAHGSVQAGAVVLGIPSVIDGDTLEIHGERVRLLGLDAPESRQLCDNASGQPYRCGQKAALALADHLDRRTVACEGRSRDRYRRLVATCFLGEEDIGAWMVSQGLALAFRTYSSRYVPEEERARAAQRGLWAGAFETPWEWRKGRRRERIKELFLRTPTSLGAREAKGRIGWMTGGEDLPRSRTISREGSG